MDCNQCTDNLTAYLDGELSLADSARTESHLATCVSCAAELSGLREAAAFVESHKRDLEIKPESWNAVYDRVSGQRSASPFRFLLPKWSTMLSLAAVAAVFVLGSLWYQSYQNRSLDDYISQYMRTREAVLRPQTMSSFAPNPFTEAKPAPDTNPFRLEDP
jgi:hypothetical protein